MSNLRKSSSDELQERNGLDHQRVFAPETDIILSKILEEITKMRIHLEIITGEEME